MERSTGIHKAVAQFDRSPSKLAAALGNGVRRQHVEHWLKTGAVPPERCIAIEKATHGAVRCEEMRPDVDWAYLRGTAANDQAREVANG